MAAVASTLRHVCFIMRGSRLRKVFDVTLCVQARETLVIELGGDATVDTTSTLQLRSSADETPLRDFLQGNNYSTPDGGAPVGPPEGDLVAPTAVLTGPATFRQPCGDEGFATIYLDSSESSGASGRPLSRSWSFSNDNDCVSHDINDQTDLLSGLLRTANEDPVMRRLMLYEDSRLTISCFPFSAPTSAKGMKQKGGSHFMEDRWMGRDHFWLLTSACQACIMHPTFVLRTSDTVTAMLA
eukprot:scaffold280155_cov18-Tisochrysis_lutea.AAC.1